MRLEGARVTLLGILHLSRANSPWIALSETCMAVVSDRERPEGHVIRVVGPPGFDHETRMDPGRSKGSR